MAKIWIDGKQWLTTDYLTVDKDLLVKGDFTLEGGGSQTYDEIVQGSLQVQGTAAVSKLGAGTYHIPAGVQHYIKGTAYLTKAYGTHYGKFYGTWTGSLGSVTTLTTDKLTAGSATIGTLQARFAGLGTKPGGYRLLMKSGSVSYVDSLGSTVFAMFKGSAQARIGMGRNVYLGSMVDAFHVWSTGCEFRVRQAYGQVTRLWVDQAVLNISKGNFGSPFPAAMSITPGSSNKVGLEIYGTASQTANLVRFYRNSAGSLVLAVGTQYALRSYGTVRMTRLGIGTRSDKCIFAVSGTAHFTKFVGIGTYPSYPLHALGSGYIRNLLAGTAKLNKIQGSYKKLVQGGSAKPGSAGYITFGRAFAAAPSAVLTQKDAWVPSVAKGPRIKQVAAGSMMAFGSPGGYMWWQATGSAF